MPKHWSYYDSRRQPSKVACSVDGCDAPSRVRGMCVRHYTRWLRYGDPMQRALVRCGDSVTTQDLLARTSKDLETGCWVWSGPVSRDGYGQWHLNGQYRAHRIAYQEVIGEIPEGMCVCHKCDVRLCINPDHLFLATNDENMADMTAKGRQARGESSGMAKLDKEKVRALRDGRVSAVEAARMWGVTRQAAYAVLKHKTWRHI